MAARMIGISVCSEVGKGDRGLRVYTDEGRDKYRVRVEVDWVEAPEE